MRASSAVVTSDTSYFSGPAFWERMWRSAGLQSAGLFIIAALIYGHQPSTDVSSDSIAQFYDGERLRIFIAAALSGLALLNLMWFASSFRTFLSDVSQGGWATAMTASSTAFASLALTLLAVSTALAYAVADQANGGVAKGMHDFVWACLVLSSFPRAMVIMSGSFGLWRAKLISNTVFAICVLALVLVLAGGTTWASDGVWAPDGLFSRYVSPLICLAWLAATSAWMLRRDFGSNW